MPSAALRLLSVAAAAAQQRAAADGVRGKVCLITGASSGMGAATARLLASAGARVVLTARREGKLRAAAAEIAAAGGDAAYAVHDVTSDEQTAAAFALAEERFGGVDFVFANAGYNGNVALPLADKPASEIETNLLANAGGAIYTLRHAVAAFRKRGGGAIVFSSSIAGVFNHKKSRALADAGFGGGAFLAYTASKAATDAVSRYAAGQFAAENIRSWSLSLAAYDTEMAVNSAKHVSAAVGQDVPTAAFGANNPLFDTIGDPRHVAEVVLALFDGSSSWRPGQTIVCDNDATADAAEWTTAIDRPLDTPDGLPTREEAWARGLVRDVKGNAYPKRGGGEL